MQVENSVQRSIVHKNSGRALNGKDIGACAITYACSASSIDKNICGCRGQAFSAKDTNGHQALMAFGSSCGTMTSSVYYVSK